MGAGELANRRVVADGEDGGPSSATASAAGWAGFSVNTLALTRIRPASVAEALEQQAANATRTGHRSGQRSEDDGENFI